MFDQLSSLDMSRTSWKIKARVTRMWPSLSNSSNGTDGIKGYNLILLDDNDCHVHAYVYADQWRLHADKIVEGGVYVLSNFYTKEALGKLKPVSSRFLINFSPSTTVDPVEDDVMISDHKFEFVDLSDLMAVAKANANDDPDFPEFSTDVMGVVEGYQHLSKITTMYGQKDIVHFRLTDGRHSSKVSVWGNLAIAMEARYNEVSKEEAVIVILTSTKLKIFRNSVQISTLPASKVYLNLEFDVVHEMRQRLREEGYVPPHQTISTPTQSEVTYTPSIETVTLKELSEKTATDYLKMNFLCKVKVKNVEESDGWWYYSCSKNDCFGEVTKLEGKYKCSKCNKNYPVPQKRYRVVLLAEDATEAFNFVLYDRAAKRLVGKTATKLIAEGYEDPGKYPPQIKAFAGKDITLKIELNDDNILLSSTVYYAIDAYHSDGTSSSRSGTTMTTTETSLFGDSDVVEISGSDRTPGSAKSTTKKIKVEK